MRGRGGEGGGEGAGVWRPLKALALPLGDAGGFGGWAEAWPSVTCAQQDPSGCRVGVENRFQEARLEAGGPGRG